MLRSPPEVLLLERRCGLAQDMFHGSKLNSYVLVIGYIRWSSSVKGVVGELKGNVATL